jgi:ABC-type uncharacterized transport system substrate-binding protein
MLDSKKINASDVKSLAEQKDRLREALEDVVRLCILLSPYCETVDELAGMTKLALENDGQLNIILSLVTSKNEKQRAVS